MKKKNYVRKPWAFEEETLDTVRSLAQALIDCTLSIREIEEKLTHSPGCIVMKGGRDIRHRALFSVCEGQGLGRGAPPNRNF